MKTPDQIIDLRVALLREISQELNRAYAKHGSAPWGRHEFYGILLEEVDELWDAIKRDEPIERVIEEAKQVAAMVFRFIETSVGDFALESAKMNGTLNPP